MRKFIAPVIVFILFAMLLIGYFVGLAYGVLATGFEWVLIVLVPILIWLIWTFISMLRERFKEIKEEDKDDLSKY